MPKLSPTLFAIFLIYPYRPVNSFLNGKIPLFKKGKRTFFTNYRGISLLPILSKVLERCVARRIVSFTSDRIYHLQHSFRKGLSCTTQLLAVLHKVGKILDKGDEIDIVYLDLTRAFDTVCHAHLLQKLRSYGILVLCLIGYLTTFAIVVSALL